ncbi:hypothetical protein [Clostridium butyricum]|uniref:hypothetical protein n=1 Tax=Clostridium butyricum TaxID=1492 RepID=UPI00325BAA8A
MIIFTADVNNTYYKVSEYVGFKKVTRTCDSITLLTYNNIIVKILSASGYNIRGIKETVILYDGEFSEEELSRMKASLIDTTAHTKNIESEVLFAPVTWSKYLLLNNDYIYVIKTENEYYETEIKFIGLSLLKVLNEVKHIGDCTLNCYYNNSINPLWWVRVKNKDDLDYVIKNFKAK